MRVNSINYLTGRKAQSNTAISSKATRTPSFEGNLIYDEAILFKGISNEKLKGVMAEILNQALEPLKKHIEKLPFDVKLAAVEDGFMSILDLPCGQIQLLPADNRPRRFAITTASKTAFVVRDILTVAEKYLGNSGLKPKGYFSAFLKRLLPAS